MKQWLGHLNERIKKSVILHIDSSPLSLTNGCSVPSTSILYENTVFYCSSSECLSYSIAEPLGGWLQWFTDNRTDISRWSDSAPALCRWEGAGIELLYSIVGGAVDGVHYGVHLKAGVAVIRSCCMYYCRNCRTPCTSQCDNGAVGQPRRGYSLLGPRTVETDFRLTTPRLTGVGLCSFVFPLPSRARAFQPSAHLKVCFYFRHLACYPPLISTSNQAVETFNNAHRSLRLVNLYRWRIVRSCPRLLRNDHYAGIRLGPPVWRLRPRRSTPVNRFHLEQGPSGRGGDLLLASCTSIITDWDSMLHRDCWPSRLAFHWTTLPSSFDARLWFIVNA